MNIKTFLYYMNFYHDEINGGGTFTQVELVKEFKQNESGELYNKLMAEARLILKQLDFEDWEMESKNNN